MKKKSSLPTIVLWRDLIDVANKVCRFYNLTYGQILPYTSKRVRDYGEASPCDRCYNSSKINEENCTEKVIKIRLHQVNRTNRPLQEATVWHTLAHELAHLRHWPHGRSHRAFTKEVVDYIASLGYDVSRGR